MTTRTTTITTTITTRMTTERWRVRFLSGSVALALLATACSGGGSDSAGPDESSAVSEADTVTAEPTSTPAPPVDSTVLRQEPADALAAAVASLGTRYSFRSDITTPAGDQVVVAGTRVDDSMMFGIEAGGAQLDVIVVAGAVWIRQDGSDEWLASADAPANDPLLPLAAPLEVTWDTVDPTRLVATYEPAGLGLDGTENVVVQIVPTADTLTFESTSGATRLVTTLHPVPDASPIEPPIG